MIEYKTMAELKRLHLGHFFDRDTMRFFDSVVYPNVRTGKEHWYFVTSERYNQSTPRLFTVRRMGTNGTIDTVGEFQEFPTLGHALEVATEIAQAERGQ